MSIVAGRVGRPHGLDGSFHVSDARFALLEPGSTVTIAGREVEIVRRAGTEQRPIVRLADCDTREQAAQLRGEELHANADEVPALPAGEWWAWQLEGCRVHDRGRAVGTVRGLLELPSCEALEVERDDSGGELLVPLVSDAIRSVDTGAREIEIDLAFLGEPQ